MRGTPGTVGVMMQGEIDNEFWISLLLTILAWLPGVLYSFWVLGQHGTGGKALSNDPLDDQLLNV